MSDSTSSTTRLDGKRKQKGIAEVDDQRHRDVLLLAFCIRLTCAFTIATFFQPDEYFQSLEPAWQLVFGNESSAWLTWVGSKHALVKSSDS